MRITDAPRIISFLVKIASRCNLACDYCYMYSHADQSWRDQPPFMSENNRRLLAKRIGEYARENSLKEIIIIYHGGEPLLAGAERIVETTEWIKEAIAPETKTYFSLQTNGTLLSEKIVEQLEAAEIGISLSIDGHQKANDLHRLTHSGASSFSETLKALEILEKHPSVYSGLIAVIDPRIQPKELFDFFAKRQPPRLDFLLPDANHNNPPPGREQNRDIYKNWLIGAFDLWFDSYSYLSVRMFDAVLGTAVGIPSETDAFGFGDVNLLTIETDGSYHDLDVLKITAHGATNLGYSLESHPIAAAANSPQIEKHRQLLQKTGLSEDCQECVAVDACGGGSVPHRYSEQGFNNPTVYCEEMFSLLEHARNRVESTLAEENNRKSEHLKNSIFENQSFDFEAWENSGTSFATRNMLLKEWSRQSLLDFEAILSDIEARHPELKTVSATIKAFPSSILNGLVIEPAVQSWMAVYKQSLFGIKVTSIDGITILPEPKYVMALLDRLEHQSNQYPRIHQNDAWLRLPFGKTILFADSEQEITQSTNLVYQALEIVEKWKPSLLEEIRQLSPDIQFIQDPTAEADKAVSFSDNTTPGALYIGVNVDGKLIDPYLLADSIIHEHRHQKLYLLQREINLFDADIPLVRSPWRNDPRPPSGLLHALFVFVCLYEYWMYQSTEGPATNRMRAEIDAKQIKDRLDEGFSIIRTTKLTENGLRLVDLLENKYRSSSYS